MLSRSEISQDYGLLFSIAIHVTIFLFFVINNDLYIPKDNLNFVAVDIVSESIFNDNISSKSPNKEISEPLRDITPNVTDNDINSKDSINSHLDNLVIEQSKHKNKIQAVAKNAAKNAAKNTFKNKDILNKLVSFLQSDQPDHQPSQIESNNNPKNSSQGSIQDSKELNYMPYKLFNKLDNFLAQKYSNCLDSRILVNSSYIPRVQIFYNQNGSLARAPKLLNKPNTIKDRILAKKVIAAIYRCNPLSIPKIYQSFYEQWKARTLIFDSNFINRSS